MKTIHTQAALSRQSVIDDVRAISMSLRSADLQEIKAREPSKTAFQVLLDGYIHSAPCHTIVRCPDSKPVGMWGIVPAEEYARVGIVWMLCTDALVEDPQVARGFLRGCRKTLPLILDTYPVLTNLIDSRNKVHMEFISWLGFTVHPEPVLFNDVVFHQFRLTKDS